MYVCNWKIASSANLILLIINDEGDVFENNLAMGFACPVGDFDSIHVTSVTPIRWGERVMGNVTSRVAESGL